MKSDLSKKEPCVNTEVLYTCEHHVRSHVCEVIRPVLICPVSGVSPKKQAGRHTPELLSSLPGVSAGHVAGPQTQMPPHR